MSLNKDTFNNQILFTVPMSKTAQSSRITPGGKEVLPRVQTRVWPARSIAGTIVFAWILFFAFGVNELLAREQKRENLFDFKILKGESHWSIHLKESPNECIGSFSVTLNTEPRPQLKIDGQIATFTLSSISNYSSFNYLESLSTTLSEHGDLFTLSVDSKNPLVLEKESKQSPNAKETLTTDSSTLIVELSSGEYAFRFPESLRKDIRATYRLLVKEGFQISKKESPSELCKAKKNTAVTKILKQSFQPIFSQFGQKNSTIGHP